MLPGKKTCLMWVLEITSLPTTFPSSHAAVFCGGSNLHHFPQPSLLSCHCLRWGLEFTSLPQPSLPLMQLFHVEVQIQITSHSPPSSHATVLCGGCNLHHFPQPSPPLMQLFYVGVRIDITAHNPVFRGGSIYITGDLTYFTSTRPLMWSWNLHHFPQPCSCPRRGFEFTSLPTTLPFSHAAVLGGGWNLHHSPQPSPPVMQLFHAGVQIDITSHNPPLLSCNCLLWGFELTAPTT